MSCNGCRVLRKGCNQNCILRQSLHGIDSHQAQANATVFVAKFFGRAGLMSFLSSVPESQRPALFHSLLFEACGRTVNPVTGAVGLLRTGNWRLCQAAVETVLRGGALRPIQEFPGLAPALDFDNSQTGSRTNKIDFSRSQDLNFSRKTMNNSQELTTARQEPAADLNLHLTQGIIPARINAGGTANRCPDKRRAETPSEESGISTLASGSLAHHQKTLQGKTDTTVLRLFF